MKLDSLSKILIATGQINYMAASIDSVNEQMSAERAWQISKPYMEESKK